MFAEYEKTVDFREKWKLKVREMMTEQEWKRRKMQMRVRDESVPVWSHPLQRPHCLFVLVARPAVTDVGVCSSVNFPGFGFRVSGSDHRGGGQAEGGGGGDAGDV